LTWRSGRFYGPGRHVPDGIIRLRVMAAERIRIVARREFSADGAFEPSLLLVRESIHPDRRDRGHFISLLYKCPLSTDPEGRQRLTPEAPRPNQWLWHDRCLDNLIREQVRDMRHIG
jgi:colanic acid biosynthesis protein WcaH